MARLDEDELTRLEGEIDRLREEAIRAAKSDEISSKLSDYYDAIGNTQNISRLMQQLTVDIEEDVAMGGPSSPIRPKLDTIKKIWNSFELRITSTIRRLKGLPSWAAARFLTSFEKLKGALGKARDEIIQAFNDACLEFKRFILGLIEKMFEFLAQIGLIAKEKGFIISKMDVTLPTISFDSSLFGIPMPIPNVKMPEIVITIEPKDKG